MTTPPSPLLPLASTGCGCCAPSTPSGTGSGPATEETEAAGATPNSSAVYPATGTSSPEDIRQAIEEAGYTVLS